MLGDDGADGGRGVGFAAGFIGEGGGDAGSGEGGGEGGAAGTVTSPPAGGETSTVWSRPLSAGRPHCEQNAAPSGRGFEH